MRYSWFTFAMFLILGGQATPAFSEVPVELRLSPPSGTVDQEFTLSVVIKNSQKAVIEMPTFQRSEIFTLESLGRVFNQTDINGQIELEFEYTFRLVPSTSLRPGTYPLPAGSIVIDGQMQQLPRERIVIIDQGNVRREGSPTGGAVDFAQAVDNTAPYVGQQILYRAEIAGGASFLRGNLDEIALKGFWRESMGDMGQQARNLGSVTVHSLLEALYPANSGEIEIPERILTADLRKPRERSFRRAWNLMDDILGDGGWQSERRRVRAKGLSLKVQALPPPSQPTSGYVPVGLISVHSSIDRDSVIQGETVTMTVVISGDANLRPYELPKLSAAESNAFRVYDDKPKVEAIPTRNKVIMKKTFAISFVPQRAGSLILPRYTVVSFNPQKREYERVETKEFTLEVSPSSTNEKLIVSGDRPASDGQPSVKEDDNKPYTEDLRPQFVGAAVSAQNSGPGMRSLLAILFLAPFTALLIRIVRSRRGSFNLAAANRRRQTAGRIAVSALDSIADKHSDRVSSEVFEIVRRYLGDRFQLPQERFNSRELELVLRDSLTDLTVMERLAQLLTRLERSVYGGAEVPDSKSLLKDARELIGALERIR